MKVIVALWLSWVTRSVPPTLYIKEMVVLEGRVRDRSGSPTRGPDRRSSRSPTSRNSGAIEAVIELLLLHPIFGRLKGADSCAAARRGEDGAVG